MNLDLYTEEMYDYFIERTHRHIMRVRNNIDIILNNYNGLCKRRIEQIKQDHDISKFSKEELDGFVLLTHKYRLDQSDIKDDFKFVDNHNILIRNAWEHHKQNNPHHPEHFGCMEDMGLYELIDMVCDWAAMSQELNNGLRSWFLKVRQEKFKFTNQQEFTIDKLIKCFPDLDY